MRKWNPVYRRSVAGALRALWTGHNQIDEETLCWPCEQHVEYRQISEDELGGSQQMRREV